MNEPLSDFISGDSRPGGLARVCPALSKTGSEAAWQSRPHGKTIGPNLNLDQLNVLSLTMRHTRRDCETLQSP
jgi:hypothetical protein